jgi:hypothetical protein
MTFLGLEPICVGELRIDYEVLSQESEEDSIRRATANLR